MTTEARKGNREFTRFYSGFTEIQMLYFIIYTALCVKKHHDAVNIQSSFYFLIRNGQIAAILDQKNYVEELNRQLK